jgi:hypothetical protein
MMPLPFAGAARVTSRSRGIPPLRHGVIPSVYPERSEGQRGICFFPRNLPRAQSNGMPLRSLCLCV